MLSQWKRLVGVPGLATAVVLSLALGGLVLGLGTTPALAQVDGVSYTLIPTYNVVRWDDNFGLEDTELIGGRLSYNLGRYVSLQGYYMGRDHVATLLSGLPLRDLGDNVLQDQEVDIRNYGGDFVLNLGTGTVTPFVKGGGGILRLSPDFGDPIRVINMKAGGGFRMGLDRFQIEVFAEDSMVRLDRYALAVPDATGFPLDPDRDKIRHTLSLGAGVNVFLGGSGAGGSVSETDAAVARTFQNGLRGLSIPVEPFVGRFEYNDKLMLDRQDVAGIRTGLDFGRYLGLRGYYWRGVNSDFDAFDDVQSWGGEARFNLTAGQGAIPYVVGGVGQLDFMDDFLDMDGQTRSDRTMLLVGGGLAFTVGNRFKVDLSARNHLFSDSDLQDVTNADDLYSNWMFGGAVSFNVFGRSPDGRRGFFESKRQQEMAVPLISEAGAAGPVESSAGAPASTVADAAPTPSATAPATGSSAPVAAGTAPAPAAVAPAPTAVMHDYQGERVVTIPVPTEGEIYIRYGRPGGVDIQSRNLSQDGTPAPEAQGEAAPPKDSSATAPTSSDEATLRTVIRDELTRSGLVSQSPRLSDQELMDRIDARIAAEVEQRMEDRSAGASSQGSDAEVRGPAAEAPVETTSADAGPSGRGLKGFRVYTGYGVDGLNQFYLGGRVNLGPAARGSRFDLVPELVVGSGDDAGSLMGALNFMVKLRDSDRRGALNPYLMAGLGFLRVNPDGADADTEAVINFSAGVSRSFRQYTLFGEVQGIDVFDSTRILVGLQFNR